MIKARWLEVDHDIRNGPCQLVDPQVIAGSSKLQPLYLGLETVNEDKYCALNGSCLSWLRTRTLKTRKDLRM